MVENGQELNTIIKTGIEYIHEDNGVLDDACAKASQGNKVFCAYKRSKNFCWKKKMLCWNT